MIDSTNNNKNQVELVLNIVKDLKNDFESDKEKEEMRKRYEHYRK